jgi:hypothetical protein
MLRGKILECSIKNGPNIFSMLEIPRSDFGSLPLDVLLKIAGGEHKPPCDSVMRELILFGEPMNVSSCSLEILGCFVDVEKALC